MVRKDDLDTSYRNFLADYIDQIVAGDPSKRERLTIEYAGMVLEPLRKSGFDIKILEHLQVDFLNSEERLDANNLKIEPGTRLGLVQARILRELGPEILSRLKLSISDEIVWIFKG